MPVTCFKELVVHNVPPNVAANDTSWNIALMHIINPGSFEVTELSSMDSDSLLYLSHDDQFDILG